MRLTAAAILLGSALVAGCGGSGETRTVTVDGAAKAPPRTTTAPAADAPAAGGATGPTATAPALASREGNINGTPVRLELAELRRGSGTTTLVLRLTTTADERAQVARAFDDGIIQKSTADGAAPDFGAYTLDGVALIDPTNRKKYLVGRDADNQCACDTGLASVFVVNDAPLTLSAVYGAPPDDVRVVDVFVPRFGTFKDVPLG